MHPDKNPNDKERAETAFEIICKAWKIIENEETRKRCLDIIEEAKERTNLMISEKKKKLKKNEPVEEEEPERYKRAIYVMTMKLFAEAERRRRNLEQRNMEEKKRQREQEIEEEEKMRTQREWQKNFDVCSFSYGIKFATTNVILLILIFLGIQTNQGEQLEGVPRKNLNY